MHFILFYMAVLIVPPVVPMGFEINDCKFPSENFIVDKFHKYAIAPNVIPHAPTKYLSAKLERKNDMVRFGNLLLGYNYPHQPTAYYEADPSLLYTLVYFSSDMYYVENGVQGYSYLFGLVVNIPGANVLAGEQLSAFLSFVPPTGHPGCRIIGLVYEQNSRINVTTDLLLSVISNVRKFDLGEFVTTHELGDPVYGNFDIAISPFCESFLENVC